MRRVTRWVMQAPIWAGAGVTAALLLVYAVTLMPGVAATDSGEMSLAAWLPGIAHAPGFPLYALVGWLWSHVLPVGRVAGRLSLFSAVCTAVAGAWLFALTRRTLRETPDAAATSTLSAAITTALALGLGRTVWHWATVAEVYALNLMLSAAILLLVVSRGDSSTEAPRGGGAGATGSKKPHLERKHPSHHVPRTTPYAPRIPLIAAAFLFGLGLGNHLTSTALLAPAIAFWLTARCGWRFWVSKLTLAATLALLAGLAIYLYLPLRAAAGPLLNWGEPDTWQRFWWHVTARQYRVSLFSAPVGPQIIYAARLWWTQFTPVGLALLLLGAWRMARARRTIFGMLALVIIFSSFYAWAYVIEDDQDAYYLSAFLAGAVWVGWGVREVLNLALTGLPKPVSAAAARLLPIFVIGMALVMNWAACDRHADTIPEDYVRDTFAEIGPGGLLLTRDWQLYAPALYLQQVEGLRPDLAVIDTELLRRGWYFGLLHKLYPDLLATVAAEEQAFTALRDAWEHGDLPDGDVRIAQLQAAYVGLIDAFIARAEEAGRPAHIGPNRGAEPLRNATLNGQPDMEPGAGAQWQWLPVGLSFRATTVEGWYTTSLQPWRVESFARVVPTAPERKIQATRADMATLHGLTQAHVGNLAGAEADWRLALTIDPAHGPATELLQRLRSQQ